MGWTWACDLGRLLSLSGPLKQNRVSLLRLPLFSTVNFLSVLDGVLKIEIYIIIIMIIRKFAIYKDDAQIVIKVPVFVITWINLCN